MDELEPNAHQWLTQSLGVPFKAVKHIHAHQDEVYKIQTVSSTYYLKVSKSLKSEHDNLVKLETVVHVPKVIDYHQAATKEYLLLSELPGKNLVELAGEWPDLAIVDKFAEAIRLFHSIDAKKVFPNAGVHDVLVHGDMALPNIIISKQGHIGYIDFGQLTYGTPELDLADAIWSLQRNIGPDYGELFLENYGQVTRTPAIEKALAFTYQPPPDN